MNKIDSLNFMCREAFYNIETIDLGGNKLTEVPKALTFYLKNLCQLTLLNNDI
jgi:hypothetical protein